MANNNDLITAKKYENKFVPENFLVYFKDNKTLIIIKYTVLAICSFSIIAIYMGVNDISLQNIQITDVILFVLFILVPFLMNEGWIIRRNIMSAEAFVYREIKLNKLNIDEKSVAWVNYYKSYRNADIALIVLSILVLFSPYLFSNKISIAIWAIGFMSTFLIYSLIRIVNLKNYLIGLFDSFNSSMQRENNRQVNLIISVFDYTSKVIESIIIGVIFFTVSRYFSIDSTLRIFSYSFSVGFLYLLWNGLHYSRNSFNQFLSSIDELRATA